MKHEDQIMGIVYGIMSAAFILVVLSHFKWDSNWVSFLGSFFAGIITLIVFAEALFKASIKINNSI